MRYKQANNIYSTEIKNRITGAIRPGAHTGLNWSGLSSLHLMNILATVTCSRRNILTLKIILVHVSLQFFCNNFSLNSVTVEFSYSFYSSVANDFSFVLLRKLMQALQISHAKKTIELYSAERKPGGWHGWLQLVRQQMTWIHHCTKQPRTVQEAACLLIVSHAQWPRTLSAKSATTNVIPRISQQKRFSFKRLINHFFQCSDAVGWVGGRASSLKKTDWWGVWVVVCLEQGADLHMAQLMPLPLTVSWLQTKGS